MFDRRGRVDGRAPGDLDAVDARRRRPAARVVVGAALSRTDGAPRPAAPAGRDRAVGQVEPVEKALPVAHLHRRGAAVVEQHGRGLCDAAGRVIEIRAPAECGGWRDPRGVLHGERAHRDADSHEGNDRQGEASPVCAVASRRQLSFSAPRR